MENTSSKPKFDKKKWREKKYSHKLQVKQRDEKKKIILKSKLHRQLKKHQAETSDRSRTNQPLFQDNSKQPMNPRHTKLSRVEQAKLGLKKKLEEKQRIKEEKLKKKQEISQALEAYKKKKQENFKMLSKKTKKGQPVMKGRMQLLFEQVKKSVEGSS